MIPLTPQAIRRLGHRYRQAGLSGALCEPGASEVLDANQKQRIIAMVCSDPPEGRGRWTVRLVAEEAVKRKLVPQVGSPFHPRKRGGATFARAWAQWMRTTIKKYIENQVMQNIKDSRSPRPPSLEPALSREPFRRLQPQPRLSVGT